MKTLIMSSSFTTYYEDEKGNRIARIIDNENGFLDNLKRHFVNRNCMVIISGNPSKMHKGDPNKITKESFEMSGIPFKEYIYVNNENKHDIKEYLKKASVITYLVGICQRPMHL